MTMRNRCLVLFLFALMLSALTNVSAQQIPCITTPPDCTGNPWSGQQFVTITLPNGCTVTLTYRTRISPCGKDVALERISKQPGNAACNLLTIQQLVDEAAIELVRFVATVRGVRECETDWRAFRGSCFDEVEEVHVGTVVVSYYPCAEAACCWKTYRVCPGDPVSVVPFGVNSPAQPCPKANPPCVPVCEGI